jgi:cell division septation protein DedD
MDDKRFGRARALNAGLILALACLSTQAALAAGQSSWRAPEHAGLVVLRSADMVVTITSPGTKDASGTSDVRVLVEADARASGFASLSSLVDVDCKTDRVLLKQATRYAQPNLAGKGEAMITKSTWLRPAPDAYLGRVAQTVCGRKPPPVSPILRDSNADTPFVTSTQAGQARASQAPTSLRPSLAPASPIAEPARQVSPKAVPAANPRPAPPPARLPQPRAPAQVVTKPRPQAPASPVTAQPSSGLAVQILASSDPGEARRVLDQVRRAQAGQMAGLSPRVVAATVNGVVYHRARIGGFSTRAKAESFCTSVKATGLACFIAPR